MSYSPKGKDGMFANIFVCIKQVPDPDRLNEVTLNEQTKTIARGSVATVINPLDKHALEESLRIREQIGGKITMGM